MQRSLATKNLWTAAFGWLILALGSLGVAEASPLPGKWVEVRSDNFIVVSNAKPKEARKVATHFEQIRAVFAREMPSFAASGGPPLKVFAPANERAMRVLLPQYWNDSKRAKPAGVFSRSPSDNWAVVQADLVGGDYFGVVYHEYFHYLAAAARLKLPFWLSEGLAEYWGGGTYLRPKVAEVARPIHGRLMILQQGHLLPIEELLAAERTPAFNRNPTRVQKFYAQSWALTHLLLLGDETGERRQQLVRYFPLVAQGVDSLEAAKTVFGDLGKLERELKIYARRPTLSYVKAPVPPEPSEDSLTLRQLSAAQAASQIARYRTENASLIEIDELVDLAVEGAPELVTTLEARGLLHLHRQEVEEGIKAFEAATKKADASAVAYYGLAILRFHRARQTGALTPEVLAQVEGDLGAAVSRNAQYSSAYARLAEVYRRTDEDPARALALIRRAVALEPEYLAFRLREARILRESGQEEAAAEAVRAQVQETVETELANLANNICWEGSVWGLADLVMPACERAVEIEPESAMFLDSRGVARTLVGNLEGALSDFLASRNGRDETWTEQLTVKRDAWIESLKTGKNPFADGGYLVLAEDPEEDGIGWLH